MLITALCSLLAISPAVGAPLAASSMTVSSLNASTAPASEAVLWWLGSHLSGHQSTPSTLRPSFISHTSDPLEVAVLFTAFEHAATIHLQNSSAGCNLFHATHVTPASKWVSADTGYSPGYPPLAATARYDTSRRLMQYSLTSHEAATRSGLRTNRYHE
jgi:hypothetical protein